jgi:ubiquinone/menaquinone biosynthesis C-methylase UbiE
MTWEETIQYIRSRKDYEQLVIDAYFSTDLVANVERYRQTEEFRETLAQIGAVRKEKNLRLLDLGAGNGISTIAFALEGYEVTALEPDSSETIGAGAIKLLISEYKLANVSILECYAEDIPIEKAGFDIVFARQAMHHAYHLDSFVAAAYRAMNQNGLLITVRDHVVENEREKERFLKGHPLHKFYGGENAFSELEYTSAMTKSGFKILRTIGPSDSVINYHPWSKKLLSSKIGALSHIPYLEMVIWYLLKRRWNKIPGRLYSFVAQKI